MALRICEKVYNKFAPAMLETSRGVAQPSKRRADKASLHPREQFNTVCASERVRTMDDLIQGQLSFADVLELEILEAQEPGAYQIFEVMRQTLMRMRDNRELGSLNAHLMKNALKNGTKPVNLNLDSHIEQFARRYAFLSAKNQNRSDTAKFRQPVLTRSHGNCEVCGLWCAAIMHLHHVWPVSKGGASNLRNLIGLCPNCHAFTHRLRESSGGAKERDLCQQICEYIPAPAGYLLPVLSASRLVYDGHSWREVKSDLEYIQTAYLALRDSICVTYSQFEQTFRCAA